MKLLFSLLMILAFSGLNAQQQVNTPELFAQCMFSIENEQDMLQLEQDMKMHPNTKVVRLDWHSQRAFIVTMGIEALSEEDFTSWFGEHATSVSCIQIGTLGVDTVNPYPFTNCQE